MGTTGGYFIFGPYINVTGLNLRDVVFKRSMINFIDQQQITIDFTGVHGHLSFCPKISDEIKKMGYGCIINRIVGPSVDISDFPLERLDDLLTTRENKHISLHLALFHGHYFVLENKNEFYCNDVLNLLQQTCSKDTNNYTDSRRRLFNKHLKFEEPELTPINTNLFYNTKFTINKLK